MSATRTYPTHISSSYIATTNVWANHIGCDRMNLVSGTKKVSLHYYFTQSGGDLFYNYKFPKPNLDFNIDDTDLIVSSSESLPDLRINSKGELIQLG